MTGMRVDFHRTDGEGRLTLERERVDRSFRNVDENSWQVRLSRDVSLELDIKSAASNVVLDLERLQVTELKMDLDVGNYTVTMPSSSGSILVFIEANLANLEVAVPDGVAARFKTDVDLAIIEVNERRFPKKGVYYVSDDFDSAANRLEVELYGALGRVQLK